MKKQIPHLIALLVFVIITAIYFAPQYNGKAVRMGDDIQATGMSGGINEHIEKYGEHPQWAPNMFSGMPAYLINMNYDGRLIKEASSALYFMGRPAAYYFILMAGFYVMLLCFGISPYIAIAGALAYGLSSYFVIIYEAGHITKLMALSFAAPLVGAIYYTYKKNMWIGASLAGILASIEISTSHPQITYYFLIVILGLAITLAIDAFKNKRIADFIRRSGLLLLVAIFAVGSNIVQLWYVSEYAKDSTRGGSELATQSENADNKTSGLDKDYITVWSYGKAETFNLFIPNLMGGSSSGGFSESGEVAQSLEKYNAKDMSVHLPGYWGDQPFTSGPVYIGAVMIFLFVLGMFIVTGGLKWWLFGLTIFSIMLSWGRNFMWFTDLMLVIAPGFDKFRAISMVLVIAQWSIPLLGLLALKKIWDGYDSHKLKKALLNSLYITGGIALFFVVLGGGMFDFASDASLGLPEDVQAAMISERESLMRMDALRSLFFVGLTFGLVWLFNTRRLQQKWFAVAVSLLILADMIPVDKRYLNYDDFIPKKKAHEIAPSPATLKILEDNDPNFRVANLTVDPFSDATTSYFHKSVGGYHAAKMSRYQDIIEKYLSKMNLEIYNMLNTKYFIVGKDGQEPVAQLNEGAFGNAWFIDSVIVVDNADQEIEAIGKVDLYKTAIIDKCFENKINDFRPEEISASITLTDYKANALTYKSITSADGIAVFSEIYYPKGWNAFIDGKKCEYFRADYILRAMFVPAGEHVIEFRFEAPNFNTMKMITIASSIALLLLLAVGIYIDFRNRKNKE